LKENEPKKNRLDFSVFPLWDFLGDTYGMEEAFKVFGPYRGANIIPKIINKNTIEVSMPLVLSNTNYVGTHFGGSLYSMCDPFFMFLLIWNLGENYIIWDKGAKIDFVSPGKGTVKVIFTLSDEEFETVRQIVKEKKKTIRIYHAEVLDENGKIVATVEKELYIRRKL
jgi:acyl-coenzyme A thioesterase PaaI-like protein